MTSELELKKFGTRKQKVRSRPQRETLMKIWALISRRPDIAVRELVQIAQSNVVTVTDALMHLEQLGYIERVGVRAITVRVPLYLAEPTSETIVGRRCQAWDIPEHLVEDWPEGVTPALRAPIWRQE